MADSEDDKKPETLTVKGLILEFVIAFVLIIGAWGIEVLKEHLHPTPPLTLATLWLSDFGILFYFLGAFVKALRWALKQFDHLVNDLATSPTLLAIIKGISAFSGFLVAVLGFLRAILPKFSLYFFGAMILLTWSSRLSDFERPFTGPARHFEFITDLLAGLRPLQTIFDKLIAVTEPGLMLFAILVTAGFAYALLVVALALMLQSRAIGEAPTDSPM